MIKKFFLTTLLLAVSYASSAQSNKAVVLNLDTYPNEAKWAVMQVKNNQGKIINEARIPLPGTDQKISLGSMNDPGLDNERLLFINDTKEENKICTFKVSKNHDLKKPGVDVAISHDTVKGQVFQCNHEGNNGSDSQYYYIGLSIVKIPSPNTPVVLEGDKYGFDSPSSIAVDNLDNIWVASPYKLTKISGKDNVPTIYPVREFFFDQIEIKADNSGNIWAVVSPPEQDLVLLIKFDSSNGRSEMAGRDFRSHDDVYEAKQPTHIVYDKEHNLWVTNTVGRTSKSNKMIIRYDRPGSQYVGVLEKAIAITSEREPSKVWTVYSNHLIGFNARTPGELPDKRGCGNFSHSVTLAVDSNRDNFWVADAEKNNLTRCFGGGGHTFADGFSKPVGVAVDSLGRAWVVNNGNNSVVKFNPNYPDNPIIYDTPNFKFGSPAAIAVDSKDQVWVVNREKNSVTKFNANIQNKGVPLMRSHGAAN